jgi:hypothetical protein
MTRALALCGLLLATTAAADARNPYLLQAKVFYQGLDFEKCLKRLDQAGKWENSTEQLADIELYVGLCQLALGKEKDAIEHFELALTIDDQLPLPPLQGPKVTALFEKVRARVVASKPQPAKPPEPVVVEPVKPPPAPLASDVPLQPKLTPTEPVAGVEAAPPKERRLAVPIVFGATAVVAGGVAAFFGVQAKSMEQQANAAGFESDSVSIGRQARTNALIANVGYAVAGAAAVTAVVTYLLLN